MPHYEIERKYLIRLPEDLSRFPVAHIEQTYLENDGATERVRRIEKEGGTVFFHTLKRRINGLRCVEEEGAIPPAEAEVLLARPRVGVPVVKDRYYYRYGGHTFEIDVYPFWSRQCVMEVEMESEAEAVDLPPDITVIREVTGERRYKNAALAREVPREEV